MNVLLIIDLQNDFMPGGPLAVAGADQTIECANQFMDRADYVVATQDWHPPNHGSFASQHPGVKVGDIVVLADQPQVAWPDHCIANTPGADFHDRLDTDAIDWCVRKGMNPAIDSYSGFFDNGHQQATGLNEHLRGLSSDPGESVSLDIMGVATDYCVKFTVLDALKLGYRVRVHVAGCRSVVKDPTETLNELFEAGAEIIDAERANP